MTADSEVSPKTAPGFTGSPESRPDARGRAAATSGRGLHSGIVLPLLARMRLTGSARPSRPAAFVVYGAEHREPARHRGEAGRRVERGAGAAAAGKGGAVERTRPHGKLSGRRGKRGIHHFAEAGEGARVGQWGSRLQVME
jgi:hypothetical protein